MGLAFTDKQAKTIATAVTILSTVVILVAFGALVWMLGWFLKAYSAILLPLAVGGIAALVFRPYYAWLTERARLPGPVALATVLASIVLPVVAFVAFFGTVIAQQIVELVSQFPVWWRDIQDILKERWPQVVDFLENSPYGQRIKSALSAREDEILAGIGLVGAKAVSAGAGVVRGIGTLLSWVVLPVYFAVFLMAKPKPLDSAQVLPFLKAQTRDDVVYLVREFVSIVVAFFRGQLIIAFLQGVLFAIGFSLVGLKYGFVLGLALGFLNIIPYLGSMLGLGVALPLAFFQYGGGWGRLAAVLAVFMAVQLIEGYLLTPKIMGQRTGLHFMVIIVAIFFWGTALGGVLGMILAIPLTAFLASLWRLAKEKYIAEIF